MERLARLVGYRGERPIYVLNRHDLRGRPSQSTITALCDRLGAYEDIGLAPDEVREKLEFYETDYPVQVELRKESDADRERLAKRCAALERGVKGRCAVCKKADPPKLNYVIHGSSLRSCKHLFGAIASTGRRNCPHFEFDEALLSGEDSTE